jgi:hypothetical protein
MLIFKNRGSWSVNYLTSLPTTLMPFHKGAFANEAIFEKSASRPVDKCELVKGT